MRITATAGCPVAYPFVSLSDNSGGPITIKVVSSSNGLADRRQMEVSREELILIAHAILNALALPTA